MKKPVKLKNYSSKEELLNILSHFIGLVLSVIGLYFLVRKATYFDNKNLLISFLIFGVSLIILYASSTLYHGTRNLRKRNIFKIFDHISIYILIAGTYTPFAMITLKGAIGSTMLVVIWSIALIGAILKLFFTGKFQMISTILYVVMGWIIILAIEPLKTNISEEGFFWLMGGGLSYTVGAIIYSLNRLPYNHAIFHFFVLGGSYSHFIAVYNYVLP